MKKLTVSALLTATLALSPGSFAAAGTLPFAQFNGAMPIQHVVVLVMENRTVDNLFNGFPGANTVRVDPVTGIHLMAAPLKTSCDPIHSHGTGDGVGFVTEFDNGKMDGFGSDTPGCGANAAYSYVRASDVGPVYWAFARNYALADTVYQNNQGPSFPAHQYLIAGTACTNYPMCFSENTPSASCNAPRGTLVEEINVRTPYPGNQFQQAYPCGDYPAIFDLMNAAGLSWHYYSNDPHGLWSGPQAIRHLNNSPNTTWPAAKTLFSDIANGKLANLSYVIPDAAYSDHPRNGLNSKYGGPDWVGAVANAIGASKYWDTTTILVTWDDWGGWYDHVKPLIANSYEGGFRTPLVVISPYAISGSVDHAPRFQASILRYTETVFGLGSLGTLDAKTDDLSSMFNYRQRALPYRPVPAPPPSVFMK